MNISLGHCIFSLLILVECYLKFLLSPMLRPHYADSGVKKGSILLFSADKAPFTSLSWRTGPSFALVPPKKKGFDGHGMSNLDPNFGKNFIFQLKDRRKTGIHRHGHNFRKEPEPDLRLWVENWNTTIQRITVLIKENGITKQTISKFIQRWLNMP